MDISESTDEGEDTGGFHVYGDSEDDEDSSFAPGSGDGASAALETADTQAEEQRPFKVRGRKRMRGNALRFSSSISKKELPVAQQLSAQELAEEVAEALGLHPYRLAEHEQGVQDDEFDEELYFKIRNHIVAFWRYDVSQFLSEEAAAAQHEPQHRHLVAAAWGFLHREGYINWGVASAITDRPVLQRQETVIIIGSGLAGLSAARQLRNHGYKVLVLEGADRPGGRVHTQRLEGGGEAAVADLGGSIITGVHSNPLAVLARQLDIPLHDINGNVPLYLRDGSELDAQVDKESNELFNRLLDKSAELRGQMPPATAISLQAAVDGLWERHKAEMQDAPEQQQQQQEAVSEQQQSSAESPTGVRQHQQTDTEQHSVGSTGPAAKRQRQQEQEPQRERQREQQQRQPQRKLQDKLPQQQQRQQQERLSPADSISGCAQCQTNKGQREPDVTINAAWMHNQHDRQQSLHMLADRQAAAAAAAASGSQTTEAVADGSGGQQEQQGQQQQRRRVGRMADSYSYDEAQQLLLHWQIANIEFANASQMRALSMKHWDLDDTYEHQGAHVFLPGSNLRLLQGLAKGVPILYKTPALLVQYCSKGVRVHTGAGDFEADACIVTVPLGVLKRPNNLRFLPPLPPRKQEAIQRLGFGCLNKVMLLFPHCFWGDKDMFGHVNSDVRKRGQFYLFYTYHGISGGAVLAALVAGDAAIQLEKLSQQQAVGEVMCLLRSIYGPQGVDVPDPLQAVMTRWASDPMTYGSYSSVAVGSAGPADYAAMARPVGDRLFFAGEATSTRFPATMHGAFDTGIREAANVMAMLAKQRGDTSRNGREARPKPRDTLTPAEPDPQDVRRAQQLLVVAGALGELFGPPEDLYGGSVAVDVEFGGFRALFGPREVGLGDTAIVQVRQRGSQGSKAQQDPSCPLYYVLSRRQLQQLQNLRGDSIRMAAVQQLGGALVGRGLWSGDVVLLDAIWQQRHGVGLTGLGLDGKPEESTAAAAAAVKVEQDA